MTPREARSYLNSFTNHELKSNIPYSSAFHLGRVKRLFSLIGNPQENLKCLHVAGTKGKGSTCIFVAYILKNAGYKVGLYTSPHLYDDKERIRILDSSSGDKKSGAFEGKISEKDFCRLVTKLKTFLDQTSSSERKQFTYFEIYTALALWYFSERRVDFAVLETGLGGRLDATNAVDSLVCAITPISLEHTKQLGKTIHVIAKEKAAIIKNKEQVAVIAPQTPDALKVIKARCRAVKAKSFCVGKDISCTSVAHDLGGQLFYVKGLRGHYTNLKTTLLGQHQTTNAAVAIGMIESLKKYGYVIDRRAIRNGIAQTRWPARFEIVKKSPLIIVDGAHNPASCRAVVTALNDYFPGRKIVLVLGISSDKDKKGICRELSPAVSKVILTRAYHPRAYRFTAQEAKNLFGKSVAEIYRSNNLKKAMAMAFKKFDKNNIILVTGSIFVAGEARALCV